MKGSKKVEYVNYTNVDPKIRTLIMIAVSLSVFCVCCDTTMIDTLQNKISISFGYAYDIVPMMMVAFTLTEAMMVVLSGKISDMYGRKPILLIGTALFLLGALTVALSVDKWMAILGRAFEGVGSGAIVTLAMASVADMYAPENRGKIQGVISLVFATGLAGGPLIGGFLAAIGPEGWRLAFSISIPVMLFSFFLFFFKYPSIDNGKEKNVDFLGTGVLMVLLVDVLLFFGLYGTLSNYIIIAMGVLAIPLLIWFIKTEKKAKEPIISPGIFKNRTVLQGTIIFFFAGFSLVAVELFTNLYAQKIIGLDIREAGFYVLLLVVGMMMTSSLSIPFIDKTGCKPWIVTGSILLLVSMLMFSSLSVSGFMSTKYYMGMGLFVCGVGLGAVVGPTITAVQNSCALNEVGMITSTTNLFRSIGGTMGTTILSLISYLYINGNAVDYFIEFKEVGEAIKNEGMDILKYLDPGEFMKRFPELFSNFDRISEGIRWLFTDSIRLAFLFTAVCLIVMVIMAVRFDEKRPGKKDKNQ